MHLCNRALDKKHCYPSTAAPDDYTAQVDTSITIEGSSATVLVEIVEDNVSEGEESFSVLLALPDTGNVVFQRVDLGGRTAATVVIRDAGQLTTKCCVCQFSKTTSRIDMLLLLDRDNHVLY